MPRVPANLRAFRSRKAASSELTDALARVYARNVVLGMKLWGKRQHVNGLANCDVVRGLVLSKAALQEEEGDEVLFRAALLRFVRREGETLRTPPAPGAPLGPNLALLGELLGLSALERDVLLFAIVQRLHKGLEAVTDLVGDLSLPGAARLVAAATGHLPSEVLEALRPGGRLVGSGLLRVNDESSFFEGKFDLDVRLLDLVLLPELTPDALLAKYLPLAPAPTLDAGDYVHLAGDVELARRLLAAALERRGEGVNILLAGPTGTGKTELAKVLAQAVGAQLFVVGKEDAMGHSAEPRERLASVLLGNKLLAKTRALLLFDEMEDLFLTEPFAAFFGGGRRARAQMSKQWFNLLLETNQVPTLWVTNDTSGVDPAFLRRFTYVIELRPLGRAQRRRVWQRHLGEDAQRLGEEAIDALAGRFRASAAQVGTAVAAARLLSPEAPPDVSVLDKLLSASERLVTGQEPAGADSFARGSYRLDVLHSPVELQRLVQRLSGWRKAEGAGVSLCLYGPPGTGKSEFIRYLAHELDKPLVYRRVSDIESMWLGQTEKNIAAAFREAEESDAILVFDEADSFLRDRRGAQRSWEVTSVNEFLQQLERFRGIVACTTNLLHELDQASLRRFVFKIPFLHATPEQAVRLFETCFAALLPAPLSSAEMAVVRSELAALPNLGPGDFAAVARRQRVLGGSCSASELLAELRAEASMKERSGRVIGF